MKSSIVFFILFGVASALRFNRASETAHDPEAEEEFAKCISRRVEENPLNPFFGPAKTIERTIPYIKAFCWDMTVFRSIVVDCGENSNVTEIKDESLTSILRDAAVLFRETCKNPEEAAENAICMSQQLSKTKRNEKPSCQDFDQQFGKIQRAMDQCNLNTNLQDVIKRGLENQREALCSDDN